MTRELEPQKLKLVKPSKNKYIDQDEDSVLFSIEKMLGFIHNAFYTYYDSNNEIIPVREILQAKITSIFKGQEIIFSSLFSKGEDVRFTKEGIMVEDLGGILGGEQPTLSTNFIATNEYRCKFIFKFSYFKDKGC